jgi:hypothetical protein
MRLFYQVIVDLLGNALLELNVYVELYLEERPLLV